GADTPPLALTLAALTLAAVLLVLAGSALPRRSPYTHDQMFHNPRQTGGFHGRVAFFRERSGNLLHPLMVYKFELEGALVHALGVPAGTRLKDLIDVMKRRGYSEGELASVRQLLLDLDDLWTRQDRPPSPPKISARRFSRMVATGE